METVCSLLVVKAFPYNYFASSLTHFMTVSPVQGRPWPPGRLFLLDRFYLSVQLDYYTINKLRNELGTKLNIVYRHTTGGEG